MPRAEGVKPVVRRPAGAVAVLALCAVAQGADFDVTRYGAVADGITDSTRGIQSAIDAASRAGGGTVVLPAAPAPYLIRDTISVRASNIEIRGAGARILLANAAINGRVRYVLSFSGEEGARLRKVTLRGLTVDANYFNQAGARGSKAVVFRLAEDALVEDVAITRPYVGLSFQRCVRATARRITVTDYEEDALDAGGMADEIPGGTSVGIVFSNIEVRDAPRAARDGTAFEIEDGAQGVLIRDVRISNIASNGIALRNHNSEMNHSIDIELRDVSLQGIGGDFAIFARSAPRPLSATNSYRGVRLINVNTDAPVAFWGPVRNLELSGGRFGSIQLGFDSSGGPAQPVNALADVRLGGLQADTIRINGASESVILSGVSARSIRQEGAR